MRDIAAAAMSLTPLRRFPDLSSKRWPQDWRIAPPSSQRHWQTHPLCTPSLSKPQRGWAKEQTSLTPTGRPGGVRDRIFLSVFRNKKCLSYLPGRPGGVRDTYFRKKGVSLTSRAPWGVSEIFLDKKKASLTPLGRPRRCVRHFFLKRNKSLSHLWRAPEVWEKHFFSGKRRLLRDVCFPQKIVSLHLQNAPAVERCLSKKNLSQTPLFS